MNVLHFTSRSRQRGAAAVEFALVAVILFLLLIGIMELGRVLFYMNSAAEATRLGARIAVVCDIDAPGIQRRMRRMLNLLEEDNIQVTYNGDNPGPCTAGTCRSVTVSIQPNLTVNTAIPFLPERFAIRMPSYSTTLPRESMRSVVDDANNALCN